MGRCEDFPCCGHELGCCPEYDERGVQKHMVCVCGAKLPITARFSICDSCLNAREVGPGQYEPVPEEEWELHNPGSDVDADVAYWRRRALRAEGRSGEDITRDYFHREELD